MTSIKVINSNDNWPVVEFQTMPEVLAFLLNLTEIDHLQFTDEATIIVYNDDLCEVAEIIIN